MADEPVTLAQVKMHLRLEADDEEQDAYLAILMPAARRHIENATGRTIVSTWPTLDEDDRTVVAQAMLLLIGHWYNTREVVGKETAETPFAVSALIAPLRIWHV